MVTQETPDFVISDEGVFENGGVPERIGKYRIESVAGKGGGGIVYKGFDPFVSRDVAVKVALQSVAAGEEEKPAEEPPPKKLSKNAKRLLQELEQELKGETEPAS